jgi:squalene-hopene/tetraprenyl-beta-curcumene cyclase
MTRICRFGLVHPVFGGYSVKPLPTFGPFPVSWCAFFLVQAIYMSAAQGADKPAWLVKATGYLDERAQKLKAWQSASQADGTACITCHTGMPYLLARPRLRQAAGDADPTKVEKQLLADITKRVTNWPTVRPWYPGKKQQSLGTEAVLNALVLANQEDEKGKKKAGAATSRALRNLWQQQCQMGEAKGSWPWLDFGLEPWESPGAAYYGTALAALAVGTVPGNIAQKAENQSNVRALRAYLVGHYGKQNLHNRIVLLWASTKLPDLLAPGVRQKLINEVLARQRVDGGWSLSALGKWQLSSAASDGYATGLVVFVLHQAGLKADHAKVKSGLAWLRKNQDAKHGSWPVRSVNREQRDQSPMARNFMTDAGTAYGALALTIAE